MKHLYFILAVCILLPFCVQGQQNHVPNGSFEYYITCPTSSSQVTSHCQYWRAYTNSTPDYMHGCNTGNFVGVPNNSGGYQPAAQGIGYIGFAPHANVAHFEYIATPITPLQPGVVYEVSISVNRADVSGCASDNIGVFFYDSAAYTLNTTSFLTISPQVHYGSYGIIYDTVNWVRLTATFQADSAYDNIVIGGFNNAQSTYNIDTTKSTNFYSYYYIDSVVIKIKDSFTLSTSDSILCALDTFHVSYHAPAHFSSNNVFTVQLSDKTGSFSSPVNIGSRASDTSGTITCTVPSNVSNGTGYKLRVVASNQADTTENISPNLRIGNPDSTVITATGNTPLCAGNVIQFQTSSSISPTTYQWTGPNGFNSTLANPYINGAAPVHNGNYYVTAHFYGCNVKDTITVVVKPLPVKPDANSNTPLCAGAGLQLTATGSSNATYSWTGPNSFSSASQNPAISNTTTAMSGDYIVTIDSNGCLNKDTVTVLIKPLPTPVTASSNTPVCAGDTLKVFSTASSTGATYTWIGPGSYSANTQNSSRANAASNMTGWYKITVTLNGCTTLDSTYATVTAIPSAPSITFNNPLCTGETLHLQASSVSGATYSWTGPGSFTAAVQNPDRNAMQFGDTGTYKATATVNGCVSPEGSITVHINPVPFVVILANPADSICQGDPVVFTALPNNYGGTPNYQWKVNAQSKGTGSTFNTSTLNNGDVILCEMTEHTKCSAPYKDESNDITMTVLPWLAPSVTISANPTHPLDEYEYVTFTAVTTNAGNNPQYQWKRNGKDVLGAKSYKWSANTLSDNDSISVEIISDYKCPQPTNAVSNYVRVKMTGVKDIAGIGNVVLYPNPNNGKFVIEINGLTSRSIDIEVVNTLGQVVYMDNVQAVNGTIHQEADLHNAVPGVYLLRLKDDNGYMTTIRFRVE